MDRYVKMGVGQKKLRRPRGQEWNRRGQARARGKEKVESIRQKTHTRLYTAPLWNIRWLRMLLYGNVLFPRLLTFLGVLPRGAPGIQTQTHMNTQTHTQLHTQTIHKDAKKHSLAPSLPYLFHVIILPMYNTEI